VRGFAPWGAAALLLAGCAGAREAPPPRAAGAVVLRPVAEGGGERFLGGEACRACHPGAYAFWAGTAHARSLATLAGPDRGDPSCLRCHVTGYGDPLGFLDAAATPGLAAVSCEACHGAAAGHARSRYPELVPTATGGECPPCEENRICRLCHTPQRSPRFDLGRDLPRVDCRAARAGGGAGR
jgi:hypothetical protein